MRSKKNRHSPLLNFGSEEYPSVVGISRAICGRVWKTGKKKLVQMGFSSNSIIIKAS
jgi:predicted DNA-binding protein (UPF0251 family)